MTRTPASRKKKTSDESAAKAVKVVDVKYVPRIEHHKQSVHKLDFDEEPYDFSDYPVEYWNTPNKAMLDLI